MVCLGRVPCKMSMNRWHCNAMMEVSCQFDASPMERVQLTQRLIKAFSNGSQVAISITPMSSSKGTPA